MHLTNKIFKLFLRIAYKEVWLCLFAHSCCGSSETIKIYASFPKAFYKTFFSISHHCDIKVKRILSILCFVLRQSVIFLVTDSPCSKLLRRSFLSHKKIGSVFFKSFRYVLYIRRELIFWEESLKLFWRHS